MSDNLNELPFVAPCKKLSPWAPFRWVKRGIADLMQAPQQSLAYGLSVALMIAIASAALSLCAFRCILPNPPVCPSVRRFA